MCRHFGATCSYHKHEAPHPYPIQSDWLSEDWDSEKAQAKEQKSLFDFNPPKLDFDKQTTEFLTVKRKLVLADDLPIQNLSIQQDKPKEESSEVTDALVPLPETLTETPVTHVAKPDDITGENNRGLIEQKQALQREEEEYPIYISMLSDKEESNIKTNADKSVYSFYN